MKKPFEIRQGSRAWELMIAPHPGIPATFWGAYARKTFPEVLAIHDEAIAAARAYQAERGRVRGDGNDGAVTRG